MPFCYHIEYDLIRDDADGESEETTARFRITEARQQTPEQLAGHIAQHFQNLIERLLEYAPDTYRQAPTGDWRVLSVIRC